MPAPVLRLLHLDHALVAVDKPSGMAVHRGWSRERYTVLQVLRDQVGRYVYPVHRLDRGTSGALVLAFDPDTARLASGGIRVLLRCDFVVDQKGNAIDGNHLRGELPTGDGVEGGVVRRRDLLVGGRRAGGRPLTEGITAEVLVVSGFEELAARAAEARGRIVLYDVPFVGYGATVRYRSTGAIEAAKLGAVATLLRSVGPFSMQTPHTGAMGYEDGVPPIPAAAITVEDAQMLHRMQDRGDRIVVRLRMEARTEPDVPSRNVVARIGATDGPHIAGKSGSGKTAG